jgi:hypothetical protein
VCPASPGTVIPEDRFCDDESDYDNDNDNDNEPRFPFASGRAGYQSWAELTKP